MPLVEEAATVTDMAPSPRNPSPAQGAEAEFLDTLALAQHPEAPPLEAIPVSADPAQPGGGQDLAAGGNPLPTVPDATAGIPDPRLSDGTALVPAIGQVEVGEHPLASPGSAQLFGSRLPASSAITPEAATQGSLALSPAPPAAGPEATTPTSPDPSPGPSAIRPEAATQAPPAPSPAPPAPDPEAATAASTATHRPSLDGPLEPVILPARLPVAGGERERALLGSAPPLGLRLAVPQTPVAPSLAPPSVTAEATTPGQATANRLPLEGPPELAPLLANPPSKPDGMPEPLEGRSRLSAAFDDAQRGGQPPAFARASTQSPPAEPAVQFPPLARGVLALPAAIQQPGWDQALGERVLWLVSKNVQSARLTLNPPELGALRVRVTVSGTAASVAFASEHGPVREAVESALPQLRQILTERGLSLDHVEVSPQGSGERWTDDGGEAPSERPTPGSGRDAGSVNEAQPAAATIHRGLIDQYV